MHDRIQKRKTEDALAAVTRNPFYPTLPAHQHDRAQVQRWSEMRQHLLRASLSQTIPPSEIHVNPEADSVSLHAMVLSMAWHGVADAVVQHWLRAETSLLRLRLARWTVADCQRALGGRTTIPFTWVPRAVAARSVVVRRGVIRSTSVELWHEAMGGQLREVLQRKLREARRFCTSGARGRALALAPSEGDSERALRLVACAGWRGWYCTTCRALQLCAPCDRCQANPPKPNRLQAWALRQLQNARPPQVTCTPEGAWRFSPAFPVRSALRQQVLLACGFEARADGAWAHPTYRPDGAQRLLTLVQQHEERLRHAWDRRLVAALHDVAPLPRLLPPPDMGASSSPSLATIQRALARHGMGDSRLERAADASGTVFVLATPGRARFCALAQGSHSSNRGYVRHDVYRCFSAKCRGKWLQLVG